jgi:hypothetical protein
MHYFVSTSQYGLMDNRLPSPSRPRDNCTRATLGNVSAGLVQSDEMRHSVNAVNHCSRQLLVLHNR